jgi:hypothetical protein
MTPVIGSDWRSVRRFHVGTGHQEPTSRCRIYDCMRCLVAIPIDQFLALGEESIYAVLEPAKPILGTAPIMGHCEYLNHTIYLPVQNHVWKLLQPNTPDIRLSFNRIPIWGRTYLLHGCLELSQVGCAKPRLLGFVIRNCFEMFCFRRRMELVTHRRSARAFRLTSSAGIACTSPRSIS